MTLPGAGSLIHVTNEDFMKNYGIRRFLPVVAVIAMLWASADSQAQGRCGVHGRHEYEGRHRGCAYVISPEGFERLVAIVKEQGFSDRKLLVIEAASLGGWFTSGQCAALMSEFDFDEKKLDVLRLLAPRLTDTCDYSDILDRLDFESSRRTAADILLGQQNPF